MPEPDSLGGKTSGRRLRLALALSLAVNLAVLGMVAGTMLAGGRHHGPPQVRDIGFGPFAAALSSNDRAALSRAFREAAPDLRDMRRDMREEVGTLLQALRTDPLDEAALRTAFAAQDARARARLDLGQRLLADRLVAMTLVERAAFADRLEAILARGPRGPRGGASEQDE
jgi:uncharacterized membrane protein